MAYSFSPSLSDLLHSIWQSLGTSMLLQTHPPLFLIPHQVAISTTPALCTNTPWFGNTFKLWPPTRHLVSMFSGTVEGARMDQSGPPDSWKQDGWIPLLPAFLNNCPHPWPWLLVHFWELWVMQFVFSSAWLQSLPQNSFVGCLRNFQLDLKPLETPSASFGVSPCLGGSLEKGIYFSQEGGHIILGKERFGSISIFIALILKNFILFLELWWVTCFFNFLLKANSVSLGPEFKLVFSIRPRSLTGILIHIGSKPGEHLCVYMEAGKVRGPLMTQDSVWICIRTTFYFWRPR